jgi:hypothetical protein
MLKHCAANRKRRLSALPNVGPYIYTTLKFLALQGAPYIYDISRLRVKYLGMVLNSTNEEKEEIQARILAANKACNPYSDLNKFTGTIK